MDFVKAVKLFSDDPSAQESGGLMGGIRMKDLGAKIRAEVENLEIEQFTPPVQTGAGFHIFYLVEKKFTGSAEFLKQKEALEMELRGVELGVQTRRWLAEQRQKSNVDLDFK